MSGALVSDYEIFKNGKDALAFFFFRQESLDKNPKEGPFWFTADDRSLFAGTKESHAIFEGVEAAIIDLAKQRGVIMLVEFENDVPMRCTPCYFKTGF